MRNAITVLLGVTALGWVVATAMAVSAKGICTEHQATKAIQHPSMRRSMPRLPSVEPSQALQWNRRQAELIVGF